MRRQLKVALLGAALVAVAAVAGPAVAAEGEVAAAPAEGNAVGCAEQFEAAITEDMTTFGNFDREAWRAVHHVNAVSIFGSGRVVQGRDAIVDILKGHFDARNATWDYTELYRHVEGCKSGYVLYDTTYAIPSIGFVQRAIVGVTYVREHGKWLVIADQNTVIRPPA